MKKYVKSYKKHKTKYKKKTFKLRFSHFCWGIPVLLGLFICSYQFLLKDYIPFSTFIIIIVAVIIQYLSVIIFRQIIISIQIHTYKTTMKKIDNMSGQDFEVMLKRYFEKRGYKAELTPTSNDYGADLVLTKRGIRTVVQAKRYKNSVGNSAVQEIVAAKAYYKAKKCIVITNSFFTKNAIKLAKVNKVELWDRNRLKTEFKLKN